LRGGRQKRARREGPGASAGHRARWVRGQRGPFRGPRSADRMRSSGVGSLGPGAGRRGVWGAAPGKVKLRAAPGWLGDTCAGGGVDVGRVKPGPGAEEAGGVASGGSSSKLPWARAGERLSSCKSRDNNAGGLVGAAASSAQAGQSPIRGSSAPHLRHFDTAKHKRRNEASKQERGSPAPALPVHCRALPKRPWGDMRDAN